MILETILWLAQATLLGLMLRFSMNDGNNELQRLGNPIMWFGLFYTFWFLIPQLFALFPGNLIIGFEDASPRVRQEAILKAQCYLLLFMACVGAGFATVMLGGGWRYGKGLVAAPLESTKWIYALGAFAVGLVAFHSLGSTFASLSADVHRSALVKTTSGKATASISFLASWAAAYLTAHLWLQKRRALSIGAFLVYAYVAFFIDARGRLMWPAVEATLFIWLQREKVRVGRLIVYIVLALAALALIDPLFISFRDANSSRFNEALSVSAIFESLFFTRNFDGFANIVLITHYDRIPETPSVLLLGARDIFMNTYYPGVYSIGVAFPSTFPGEFWIAGKGLFLVACSLLYGIALGLLNIAIRGARTEAAVWLYLLTIPYIAGIGNELIESAGKMLAAAFPAVAWLAYDYVRKKSVSGPGVKAPGRGLNRTV